MPEVTSIRSRSNRENSLKLFTRLTEEEKEVHEHLAAAVKFRDYLIKKEQAYVCIDELERFGKKRSVDLAIMLKQMEGDL